MLAYTFACLLCMSVGLYCTHLQSLRRVGPVPTLLGEYFSLEGYGGPERTEYGDS